MLSSPFFLLASAASVVLPFLAPVEASCAHGIAGIHAFERRADTDEHVLRAPKFGYDIEDGPLNWHALAPENAMCAEGTNQSPIIVRTESHRVSDKGSVKLSMPSNQTDVVLNNLGTTIEFLLDGSLWADNRTFNAVNVHFHTPSEHRIDLAHHEAEMHMVFQSPDDKSIAVLAFLIDVAAFDSDPALERVLAYLPAVQAPLTTYKIPKVDMADFIAAAEDQDYYIYSGSFTTPPCTEGILFHVATKPIKLRAQTFIGLKKLTKTNARNSQAQPGHVSVLSSMAKSVTALEAAMAVQAALVEAPQKQERRSAHF